MADRSKRTSPRLGDKRRFMITGFSATEKERLASIIRKLSGEYIDDRAFTEKCTHLICEVPNRSEKFLGACSTGRWILKSSYLDACTRAGNWVGEELHEWTDRNIGKVKYPFLYRAPRRWREYVRKTERPAFDSWRVVLVIDDLAMKLVFRRLLECGGADAVICKLPPSVDRCITHIFVKTKLSYDYLAPWRDHGVPCLAPDFIGDYLVEDNFPPLCSRDIFLLRQQHVESQASKPPVNSNGATKNAVSNKKSEPPPISQDSTFVCDSRPSSCSSSSTVTPVKKSPGNSINLRGKLNPFQNLTNKIGSRRDRGHTSSGSETPNEDSVAMPKTPYDEDGSKLPSKAHLRKLFVKIDRCDSPSSSDVESGSEDKQKRQSADRNNNNNGNKSNMDSVRRSNRTQRLDYAKIHFGKITPTEEEKKKNLISRETANVAMEASFTGEDEMTSLYGSSPKTALKRQSSDVLNPKPMKRRCYDDGLISLDQQLNLRHQTLVTSSLPVSLHVEEIFNACYEENYFPEALYEAQTYMNSRSHPTSEMIWKLMTILFSSTDKDLSESVYNTLRKLLSLHPPSNPGMTYTYLKSIIQPASTAWEFLTATIDAAKGENIDDEMDPIRQSENALLLLEYLTAVFGVNLLYCEASHEKTTPLFASVLWTSTEFGELNFKVRHLMSLVTDTVVVDGNPGLRKLLFSLVISAFRSLQIVCKETQLNCGKSEIFIAEFARRLHPERCDLEMLRRILESLRDTTLGIGVMSFTLDTMDSIIFMDKCNDISLGKILGHYLFCIPKNGPRNELGLTPKSKKNVAPLSKTVVTNINKRNIRGETKLHSACIKGDPTMVRQLLNVPGIDVNVQDFAGWTALHEACNAGHLECVKVLLDYKPPKTIESYFSPKPLSKVRNVDFLLSDPTYGTTVLHDAVMNNRVEVAKLLVKRGGKKLLEQTNAEGKTPLELAETEPMLDALMNSDDLEMNSSQMDWSQLSTQSEEMNEMYNKTDNMSCTSVAECERFLLLFEALFLSFVRVNLDKLSPGDEGYFHRFPKYVRKLKRHIERIVLEEAKDLSEFASIFEKFDILAEAFV